MTSSARISTLLAVVMIFAALLVAAWASTSPPAAAGAAAPVVPAASVTLIAQQDSWIYEGLPDTNYGHDKVLNVGRVSDQKSEYNARSLVWFDLSGVPAGAKVISATLELYQVEADGAERYTI